MIAYRDGEWVEHSEVRVHVDDPGFLVGDGVFESVRLHRGRYFRLRAHLERLRASAEILDLTLPPAAELEGICHEIADRNALEDASTRLVVTRGRAGAGASVLGTARAIAGDWRARAERGWRLITARTRHPAPDVLPPPLKSLGRVHSVIARLEARRAGVDDALLLSHDGAVAEGPTWNVFLRCDGRVVTPPVDVGVLPGVTRAAVLELAATSGARIREARVGRDALGSCDAAFATMSSLGVVPILELDGRALEGSTELAAPLQTAYWDLVREESGQ